METLKKYLPIFISIMVFCITIIIFLFNEKFDKHLPFDSGKFGTIVAILGVILNSLTIFLLYKQIQEMAEGRKAANQPDLYPLQLSLTVKNIDGPPQQDDNGNFVESPLPIPLFLNRQFSSGVNNYLFDFIFRGIEVTINNIGLGTAKDITIKWEFDYDKIINIIKDTYYYEPYYPFPTKTSIINSNTSYIIKIPYLYMQIYGPEFNPILPFHLHGISKPNLYLTLTYKDIYNNKYSNKFFVSIEALFNNVDINFIQISN